MCAGPTMSDTEEVRQLIVHPALWPHITDWLNQRGLDVNRISAATDDDLATYTAGPRAPGADVCLSRGCPRPGSNSAGFCCHGCAAHHRFGASLLHGDRCEAANPGVEETADPLHAAIAAVLYDAPDTPSDTAARYRRVEAEHRADKVMEAIKAKQARQSAALTRPVEIDTYEQSYHDVTAALELAADGRTPITVTTCNNNVTTYLPVPLNVREQP